MLDIWALLKSKSSLAVWGIAVGIWGKKLGKTKLRAVWSERPTSASLKVGMGLKLEKIRSSKLPFTWVGNLTCWVRSFCKTKEQNLLAIARPSGGTAGVSVAHWISGRLKSPSRTKLLSVLSSKNSKRSHSWVEPGGGGMPPYKTRNYELTI